MIMGPGDPPGARYGREVSDARGAVPRRAARTDPGVSLAQASDASLPRQVRGRMREKVILLVEDNLDDELLTLRALKKNNVTDEVVVARDGAEALDYLFATGEYAGRDTSVMPQLILLDIKLPRIDGLEVLRCLRADERTRLVPVVILTSSKEVQDMLDGYGSGANSYIRKPVNFEQFVWAVEQLKLYWLSLNEAPPRVV
jgi:two-component system response regulator